jgi:hypothetical protein
LSLEHLNKIQRHCLPFPTSASFTLVLNYFPASAGSAIQNQKLNYLRFCIWAMRHLKTDMRNLNFPLATILILIPFSTFGHGLAMFEAPAINLVVFLIVLSVISIVGLNTKGRAILWSTYILTFIIMYYWRSSTHYFDEVDNARYIAMIAPLAIMIIVFFMIRKKFPRNNPRG